MPVHIYIYIYIYIYLYIDVNMSLWINRHACYAYMYACSHSAIWQLTRGKVMKANNTIPLKRGRQDLFMEIHQIWYKEECLNLAFPGWICKKIIIHDQPSNNSISEGSFLQHSPTACTYLVSLESPSLDSQHLGRRNRRTAETIRCSC